MLILGSANEKRDLHNLFDLIDRSRFWQILVPGIRIVGLPDFVNNDEEWFFALDQILRVAGIDPMKAVFLGVVERILSSWSGTAENFISLTDMMNPRMFPENR